ncbi:DNA primase [Tepidicaulis marinus]|uniref:DNA primase n=1 Tax=Tepidicaulis marinus TaxID=1333998 RepID=A0A081B6E5_9HYPH|nr:hypothetical protein [Tepidicaulis marinus]GAK43613.1 DNA primase [Tepidicaulis marinus]
MDSGTALSIIGVIISGAALMVSFLAFLRLLKLDRSGKFKELGEAIDKIEDARIEDKHKLVERISRLEGALTHIPTAEQLAALRRELHKAEAAIANVNARIEGFDDILRSHENRLSQIFEDALVKGRSQRGGA